MTIDPIIGWEQITLQKAIDLMSIEMPDKILTFYKAQSDKARDIVISEINDKDIIKVFPNYYGKVISVLYDIPEKDMTTILKEERKYLYDNYCLHWVSGLLIGDYETAQEIESFDFEGETYYLPKSKLIVDNMVHGKDMNVIEFQEAADLEINSKMLESGNYKFAPNIISIFCRPKCEKYNENKCLERAELFKRLPMSIVWDVFFSILKFGMTLNVIGMDYLMAETIKNLETLTTMDI